MINNRETEFNYNFRKWTYESGRFWMIDLLKQDRNINRPNPAIQATFGEISLERSGEMADAVGEAGLKDVKRRLERGRRCFVTWVDEKITAYGWVANGPECIGELEHEFKLPLEEAYIWDCFTLPEYRRKKLYTALLQHMLSVISKDGITAVWIGSSLSNLASIKGFIQAGFQPVADVVYWRLLNFSCTWVKVLSTTPDDLICRVYEMLASDQERRIGPFLFGLKNQNQISDCV